MSSIYLDHAATTPMRDEVLAAMEPYAARTFGNPSSSHAWGRAAAAALETARADVADALGVKPSEIRFVRGGTESDNIAVAGSCLAQREAGGVPGVAVSAIEHSAVLECAEYLEQEGLARTAVLEVTPGGRLDLDPLDEMLGAGPCTVSIMWANNETGVVLPVADVASRLAGTRAILHSDASQAIGKIPLDLTLAPVDLLTATAHKINGPKGAGILYVREGTPIRPLLFGGGQERALRPGTEDVAGAVGVATSIRLAVDEVEAFSLRVAALRSAFEQALTAALPDIRVNCAQADRAPHVASIGIPGIADGTALLMALDLEGLAVSGGSACHSGGGKASHVIEALYGADDAFATVRFSFGRASAESDVTRAVEVTARVVGRLREIGRP